MRLASLVYCLAGALFVGASVSAVRASTGSSGCQGYAHSNGQITCIPNVDCDSGCVVRSYPAQSVIPPLPPGHYLVTCHCIDPFAGAADICVVGIEWDGTTTPPTWVATVCCSDAGNACPPGTDCVYIGSGWPKSCDCQ